MNFLDFILILVIVMIFVITVIIIVDCIRKKEFECITPIMIAWLMLTFFFISPFIVMDKYTGYVTGRIIDISNNYFETTNIKFQLENKKIIDLCVEDINVVRNLENIYKYNKNQKIDLIYNKRVGLYSTGKCHKAPINGIGIYENH